MNVGMYQAAAAMNANSRWQEIISENLAASSVPGYKKQELTVAATQAGLIPAASLGANSAQTFTLPKVSTSINFAPGDVQFTGDKNDVAIDGKGFLQVEMPDGTIASTRDGEFQVNESGQLVTKQGYPVLGDGGSPIQLDLNNPEPMSISPTGDVSQGGEVKGKLKLVDFDKPQLLTQINGAYFVA